MTQVPRPSRVLFLPGIIMPAPLRYAALLGELGDSVHALTKELEVYAGPSPPEGYSIEDEIESISRTADEAGWKRFHLYGHSGGGAIAIAYAATHPERLLSLALDEPASDFRPETRARLRQDFARRDQLPLPERMRAFVQMQLAPGVDPPPPPAGSPPAWMEMRPAGIEAFAKALQRYRLSPEALRAFERPVYYSYGSLSAPHWETMRDALAGSFPDFTAERYEGLHHFNTSHFAEPTRVAVALQKLWTRAEEAS
jgi:pimeloyl-ACP methyl ester carboxylesterase